MRLILKILGVVWASPNTILSSLIGFIGLIFGGKVQVVRGAIEFHGGIVKWLLGRFPNNVCAMTLGHSIWGLDSNSLQRARDHEHVHVRQYERWGPFFIPAYLSSSMYMKYKGKDPYYDNPFEVEAYALAPVKRSEPSEQPEDESDS